jgi:hypothetical protein
MEPTEQMVRQDLQGLAVQTEQMVLTDHRVLAAQTVRMDQVERQGLQEHQEVRERQLQLTVQQTMLLNLQGQQV